MEKVAIIAITKNGINLALSLKKNFSSWQIYAPSKFSLGIYEVNWFDDSITARIEQLFKNFEALVCIFSLGAVIRLISPYLRDKKTDPAVVVIDDTGQFVISALSGHLGGANKLAIEIARILHSTPVITTAADVNNTIAVDLVGKEFGWKIEDDSTITQVSSFMVNNENIGVYQDAGEKNWWMPRKDLPKNVTLFDSLEKLKNSDSKGFLIISDKKIDDDLVKNSVIYRPLTLVVGIGLHWDTNKETIREGVDYCLKKFNLSSKSVARFASIRKEQEVLGLKELAEELKIPVDYFERDQLAQITIPNPSETVKNFEGTSSVAEASSLKSAKGELIVEKQKFPPNLTVAVSRILK